MKKMLIVFVLSFLCFSYVNASSGEPVALSQDEKVMKCQFSDLKVSELRFELPDFELTSAYEKSVEYTKVSIPT
ncbi:MAG: hypothetical protein H8E22_00665, partial [Candidatus Cloacimonetes bacterium]|nr:hypothetical protein [Candidatus Cloacimonadota bacterium]